MRKSISLQIKNQVALRANFRCEYCLLPDKVSFYNFHIDHIRSIKHGGDSQIDNLAYCCPECNSFKGTDVGSFKENDELIRFYNPRKDEWQEHFGVIDGLIIGKTDIAIITERIFKLNEIDRLIFRQELIQLGHYP
jgi:HNH endonuclease